MLHIQKFYKLQNEMTKELYQSHQLIVSLSSFSLFISLIQASHFMKVLFSDNCIYYLFIVFGIKNTIKLKTYKKPAKKVKPIFSINLLLYATEYYL